MSKSLRLSEKWYQRGLWLVAFVFAGFLIGLGGTIVGDLPKVEPQVETNDFIDKPQADPLRQSIKAAERAQREKARRQRYCLQSQRAQPHLERHSSAGGGRPAGE